MHHAPETAQKTEEERRDGMLYSSFTLNLGVCTEPEVTAETGTSKAYRHSSCCTKPSNTAKEPQTSFQRLTINKTQLTITTKLKSPCAMHQRQRKNEHREEERRDGM